MRIAIMDQPSQPTQSDDPIQPVIYEPDKKKKKKKYSRGLKGFQKTGRQYTKASSKVSRAVSRGIRTYLKASEKSARKKRDGALLDWGENTAKGLGKGLREASTIPLDLTKAMNTKSARKSVKRQIRGAARFARLIRLR